MKKKLSALALLGASAIVLAGCNGGTTDPGTTADPGDNTPVAETGNITVWLVGADTPHDARDYLKETFESENDGWTLTIEEKTWADTNEAYTAALSSNNAPDVVEVGNTQALGFADAGLFLDIDDIAAEFDGNLLGGLVEAGTYEDSLYAAPYYAGGRVIFYTPQIVGDTLPATLEEYVEVGKALRTDTRSGIYFPGQDWYNALPYIWAFGGEIATQDADGTWSGGFSSANAQKGLTLLQDVFQNASNAPVDGDERVGNIAFCEGNVGFLSSPAWAEGNLTGAWPWGEAAEGQEVSEGCPETFASDLGAFALPGATAGSYAPIFAGGSNIAVAYRSASPEMAKAALRIILSDEYQELLAAQGLTPATLSAASALPDTAVATAQANGLANSKFTPASPNWAEVESSRFLQDAFVKIASGADVAQIAAELDAQIEGVLNK